MLGYLDVSHNTELKTIWCDSNTISGLDVSNCLELEELACTQENLRVLVVDSRQNITELAKHDNTKVVTITQTANGKISYDSGYKFNIAPNLGYTVSTLTAGGVSQTPATTYDFGTLSNNTTLTATFNQVYNVQVGDYISYQGGDYDGKWVVLRNEAGNMEIISKESVGNVTLTGADGYVNAINILNDKAKEYVNYAYATSGRSVGGTSKSIGQIDTRTYPLTYAVAAEVPYDDPYYLDDQTIINENENLKQTNGWVWLASRRQYTLDNISYFYVHLLYVGGGASDYYYLFNVNSAGITDSRSFSRGVRPVITLRPGIRITGGAGTEDNPYTIGF